MYPYKQVDRCEEKDAYHARVVAVWLLRRASRAACHGFFLRLSPVVLFSSPAYWAWSIYRACRERGCSSLALQSCRTNKYGRARNERRVCLSTKHCPQSQPHVREVRSGRVPGEMHLPRAPAGARGNPQDSQTHRGKLWDYSTSFPRLQRTISVSQQRRKHFNPLDYLSAYMYRFES